MLFKDGFIDDHLRPGQVSDQGHVSGLIEREHNRLIAKENILGQSCAPDNHSVLNFFAGLSGAERRRHEAAVQHGALAYWRQNQQSPGSSKDLPIAPNRQASEQSSMRQAAALDNGATVYNYRRKKNATFTKLLAQALKK